MRSFESSSGRRPWTLQRFRLPIHRAALLMANAMKRRKLQRCDLSVSALALGTWGLSGDAYGAVAESVQDKVILRARSHGINLFETADVYDGGKMELRLGRLLETDDKAIVCTKLGTDLDGDPNRKNFDVGYLREAFSRSRDRLRRNTMGIVLLHNPSAETVATGEAAAWLQEQVDAGALLAWGVSAGHQDVVRAAVKLQHVPHIVQLPFNAFFYQELRRIQRELIMKKVAVFARSVLAHGLLAGMWPSDKTFPRSDHRSQRWTSDQLRRRLDQLRAVRFLTNIGKAKSLRAAAVQFVLSHDLVHSAVLGPRSVVQLDQLVREVPKEPPYLESQYRLRLENELRRLRVDPW